VLYVHQITPPLLNEWMATWKSKTYWSKLKKRDTPPSSIIARAEVDQSTLDKDRGIPGAWQPIFPG